MSVEWINESDTELITENEEDLDKVTVFRSKVGTGKTFYDNRVIMMFACKEPADDEVIKNLNYNNGFIEGESNFFDVGHVDKVVVDDEEVLVITVAKNNNKVLLNPLFKYTEI